MGSSLVEIHGIRIEEAVKLLLMEDQEVIQAFSSHTSQKTFADRIRLRSSVRCAKHFDAARGCHSCEMRSEFAIIISDEIFWCLSIRGRFAQLLRHPRIGRRSRYVYMDDLTRLQLNDEEGKKRTEEEIGHL